VCGCVSISKLRPSLAPLSGKHTKEQLWYEAGDTKDDVLLVIVIWAITTGNERELLSLLSHVLQTGPSR
jgi:hypothetical protein